MVKKPSQALYWFRYLIYFLLIFWWIFLPSETINISIIKPEFQIKYLFLGISFIFFIAALIDFLKLLTTRYEVTSERTFIYSGIINRTREEVELYRIKDYRVYSPFHIRIVGLSNISFNTSDHTTPVFSFLGLPDAYKVANMLRQLVEDMRKKKGVQEFD